MRLLNNSEEEGLTWDGPSTKKVGLLPIYIIIIMI